MDRTRTYGGHRLVTARAYRSRASSSVVLVVLVSIAAAIASHGSRKPAPSIVASDAGLAYTSAGPGLNAEPGPAPAVVSRGFSITGSVSGLYPGATRPLVLSVYNPYSVSITVTSVATTVSGSTNNCATTNLTVSAFSGALVIPPKHGALTAVKATLAHAAPDQCQGALFFLRYLGTGTAS